MDTGLQNQKLTIPVRKYNAGPSKPSETPPAFINQVYSKTPIEEQKIPPSITQPLQGYHYNPSIPISNQLQIHSSSSNSSLIKETFEKIRQNIRIHLEEKIKILTEQFQNSLFTLKSETDKELFELNKLETNLLSQISNIPKEQPKPQEPPPSKIENKKSISSVPKPENPKSDNFDTHSNHSQPRLTDSFLISHLEDTVSITTDFKTTEILSLPAGFNRGSNVMILNESEVLAVYERGSVFSINIFSGQTKKFPNFKTKRSFFGLSFIGKFPAIIGGLDKDTKRCDDTVEILMNFNHWVDGNSLKERRSHCHAIKHGQNTYVFGGFSGGYLLSIEKHKFDWVLLNVMLPEQMTNFGLGSKGNAIYLFGGENASEYLKSVFLFNTVTPGFTEGKNLKNTFLNRTNGCAKLVDSNFLLLDSSEGKVVKYFVGS